MVESESEKAAPPPYQLTWIAATNLLAAIRRGKKNNNKTFQQSQKVGFVKLFSNKSKDLAINPL